MFYAFLTVTNVIFMLIVIHEMRNYSNNLHLKNSLKTIQEDVKINQRFIINHITKIQDIVEDIQNRLADRCKYNPLRPALPDRDKWFPIPPSLTTDSAKTNFKANESE